MFSKKNYAVKNLHFKNHLLQVYIPREKSLHQIPQFSGQKVITLDFPSFYRNNEISR